MKDFIWLRFFTLKWRISIKDSKFKSQTDVFISLFVFCSRPRFWSGSFVCETEQFIDEETRHLQAISVMSVSVLSRLEHQHSLVVSLVLVSVCSCSPAGLTRFWVLSLRSYSSASGVRAVSQEGGRLRPLGSVPSELPPGRTDGRQQPSGSERVSGPSPSCRHVVSTEPDRPEQPPEYWESDRTGSGTRPLRTDPDPSGLTPIRHQAGTPAGTAPGPKEPSGESSQEDGRRLQKERQSRL